MSSGHHNRVQERHAEKNCVPLITVRASNLVTINFFRAAHFFSSRNVMIAYICRGKGGYQATHLAGPTFQYLRSRSLRSRFLRADCCLWPRHCLSEEISWTQPQPSRLDNASKPPQHPAYCWRDQQLSAARQSLHQAGPIRSDTVPAYQESLHLCPH